MNWNLDKLTLALAAGIILPDVTTYITSENRMQLAQDAAQPGLITTANAGIPAYLTNWLDPKQIEVLVAPMKAAEICGETRKGDWVTFTAQFPMVESTGETAAYGDWNSAGSSNVNLQFVTRESYHFQTWTNWGERELATTGLAKVDLASRLNISSALTLAKQMNKIYFLGVTGLQNYGLLNDPGLNASILPGSKTASGYTWAAGTATEIILDIKLLYAQLVSQTNGLVQLDSKMILAMSPAAEAELAKSLPNVWGQPTAMKFIKDTYKNTEIITAPEYATSGGGLVQMIVPAYEGQESVSCAFTEKLRAHAIERKSSGFKQKKSAGSWGCLIYRPMFVAGLLGV